MTAPTRFFVIAAAVALSACTPTDQLVGAYNFAMTGTETTTAPSNGTSSSSGMGVITVNHGLTDDYVVVLAQSGTQPCTLKGTKTKDKALSIDLAAAQTCTFGYSFGSVTATLTPSTLTLDQSTMNMLTLELNYSYAGSVSFINYAGTGKRTYTGPRF